MSKAWELKCRNQRSKGCVYHAHQTNTRQSQRAKKFTHTHTEQECDVKRQIESERK